MTDTIDGTSPICSASCVTRTAVRMGTSSSKILGTSITCTITRERVEEMHDVRQLFHHLRRRIVENRHRRDSIDNLLHGALQNPHLRPGQGSDPVRPRPAGLFFKEAEELRLGCGGGPGSWPCSSSRAPTLRPWHSSVLVRSGAYSLPGPLRRSSAHVSVMSGAVARAAAARRCRMQPTAAR